MAFTCMWRIIYSRRKTGLLQDLQCLAIPCLRTVWLSNIILLSCMILSEFKAQSWPSFNGSSRWILIVVYFTCGRVYNYQIVSVSTDGKLATTRTQVLLIVIQLKHGSCGSMFHILSFYSAYILNQCVNFKFVTSSTGSDVICYLTFPMLTIIRE